MWIFERRFPEDFGRRVYRKTNVVSENINENVEITVQEADRLRKQILAKFNRSGNYSRSYQNFHQFFVPGASTAF